MRTFKHISKRNKSKRKNNIRNKTKRKITYVSKKNFINELLKEWMKQTNGGNIKIDTTTQYAHDYYLSLDNYHNYDIHVHLILHHFRENKNTKNNIEYVFKKYKNIHSGVFSINLNNDNPRKVVKKFHKDFLFFLS